MFPSLEVFFSSYGSYHANIVNKMIHLVCIPLILITAIQLVTPYSFQITTPLGQIDFAIVFIILLSLMYISVDLVSGIVSSLFYVVLVFACKYHCSTMNKQQLDQWFWHCLYAQVTSWILQFIGHGVFEKRAPALLDNLAQVFVAPDFVMIEVLFMLGYKPEVHKACQKRINENIRQFHQKKQS